MKKPKRAKRRNPLARIMAREPNRFRTRVKATAKQYTRKGRRNFRPFELAAHAIGFASIGAGLGCENSR